MNARGCPAPGKPSRRKDVPGNNTGISAFPLEASAQKVAGAHPQEEGSGSEETGVVGRPSGGSTAGHDGALRRPPLPSLAVSARQQVFEGGWRRAPGRDLVVGISKLHLPCDVSGTVGAAPGPFLGGRPSSRLSPRPKLSTPLTDPSRTRLSLSVRSPSNEEPTE